MIARLLHVDTPDYSHPSIKSIDYLSGNKESVYAYYYAYAKRAGASYMQYDCVVSYADDTIILHGDGFYVALEPITIKTLD